MSEAGQVSLQGLNDCGCCAGLTASTPATLLNRPGLSAISYRVGTHAIFKASLLAALSDADRPALGALTTRADDDFSIALLDAWAVVADVITFYQERIANESYLRTATERFSLVQLARLIGYRLKPGVSAGVYLAFTVQDTPGSPATTVINAGTKVQSIPGPGEKPQMFETAADTTANVAWNKMSARPTLPQTLSTTMSLLLLAGTSLKLAKGDALLIFAPDNPSGHLVRVASVIEDAKNIQTTVGLVQPNVFKFSLGQMVKFPFASFTSQTGGLTSTTVQSSLLNQSWNSADLNAFAATNRLSVEDIYRFVAATYLIPPPPTATVFAMRKRAMLFGYNAPDWNAMAATTQAAYNKLPKAPHTEWPPFSGNSANTLCLDQVYKEIKSGDKVVVQWPDNSTLIGQVKSATETAAAWFGISGQVTKITFAAGVDVSFNGMSDLRGASVFIVPESLTSADVPDPSAVSGNTIILSGPVADLNSGQAIMVTGILSNVAGVTGNEAAIIQEIVLNGGYTTLTLANDLQNSYARSTVVINANVALATNGETTSEILGAGDAAQTYQQFTLKQPPLTYVAAVNAAGAASMLEVFVNDVQWHEADSFFAAGPRDRNFITRLSDDGKTTVEFGDGKTGARLPTGVANVRATYRKGIGVNGNVKAGQLSLLMTRPLGVNGVTNPVPAAGGADPEPLEQARTNAPLGLLTLERIVSLSDYQDFARGFAGIAKALATWTWDGQARGIFVTVCGPDGAAVNGDSLTCQQLLAAMAAAGDPRVRLRVATFTPAPFTLTAALKIDPDYQTALVTPQVEQALRTALSFDARDFGQPVALSEIYAVISAVPGIIAAEISALYRVSDTPALNPTLVAAFPLPGANGSVAPAELLTLDPRPLSFGILT
jgi:hypothetical protein